ncbi:SusC/RagA family TonB-linked outer membrane protein [Chitinophaga sp. ysch24]|uniref:SusC/RagA family TonB-linked outer membrane protein n=2 Tax=Chitinophaga tropicalis TaxID=2683588 RepID=A0A7K1U7M2_9BACT|nr:SusC/RagA family TonB-linked outer membrane protein [Chitinophaga tropicalis]
MINIDSITQQSVPLTSINTPENRQSVPVPVADTGRITVTGTLRDSTGITLPGVTVSIEGSASGTVTNENGMYVLKVPVGKRLVFSYIGYQQVTVLVMPSSTKIDIVLKKTSSRPLDEVVVTAFGRKQRREAVVGSVTTIQPEQLRIPASNLTNALAGQVAGVIAYQQSGQPGLDNSNFFIRGVTTFGYRQNPLILIDNVELSTEDLARLQVEDIESFSILKDASATALYGARGANGVVLVTTRSGKEGSARINIRTDQSISEPTKSIKLADPVTYMRMYNDALMTRDPQAIPFYTEDDIYNREQTLINAPGSNKYVYPVVDWLDLMFKKSTTTRRATMNVSGGGKVARYMVSASLSNDNGILKKNPMNSFNNNVNFKNYQLRSNININISKNTELIVRLWGNFNDYNGPITQDASFSTDLYNMATHTSPVLFPAYYQPDTANFKVQHILFGNNTGNTTNTSNVGFQNPYAELLRGYKRFSQSRMSATLELDQKLDIITPGLRFHGFFSTNRYSLFANQMAYNPFYYTIRPQDYDRSANTYKLYWLNSATNSSPIPTEYLNYTAISTSANTFVQFQGQFDYSKKIDDHSIEASLIGVRQQTLNSDASTLQEALPYRNLNIAGRVSYNYQSRYFIELNAGYNGSERFSQNNRFGFFPTVGTSWIVSNEKFWDGPITNIITSLKLRGSFGYTGNDAISSQRFFYLSDVNLQGGNGAFFGVDNGYSRPGVVIKNYENRNITWERAQIANEAIELTLFKSLSLVAEYWQQNRTNILMKRNIPASAGLEADINANVGTAKIKGLDLTLNYKHKLSEKAWVEFMSNLTYSQGRYGRYEEPAYAEPWRYRSGTLLGQSYGYIAERLFVDDKEASASPSQLFGGNAPLGGDIKYRDVNNDGVITAADMVPVGYPTSPQIVYGFGVSFGYRALDINARFQGQARSTFFINPTSTSPFIPGGGTATGLAQVLKVYADSHWSEDNQDLYAIYPRLGTNTNQISNNLQPSTWWMRDGSFLRLKMVEVGYTLPRDIARRLALNSCRIFVSGLNLFNFTRFKYWDIEQGGNAFSYPLQRVYNLGINVNFL